MELLFLIALGYGTVALCRKGYRAQAASRERRRRDTESQTAADRRWRCRARRCRTPKRDPTPFLVVSCPFFLHCATVFGMGLEDHDLDEEGQHYPDECGHCLEKNETTLSSCRCGKCCAGALLIEATLRDAEREPLIDDCQPIKGFTGELEGYMLNDKAYEYACRFFDHDTRLCTIWESRPLCCRLFDCDTYEHPRPD